MGYYIEQALLLAIMVILGGLVLVGFGTVLAFVLTLLGV